MEKFIDAEDQIKCDGSQSCRSSKVWPIDTDNQPLSGTATLASLPWRRGSNSNWMHRPPPSVDLTSLLAGTSKTSILQSLRLLSTLLLIYSPRICAPNPQQIRIIVHHNRSYATRRCFPGIEYPQARIERISISFQICQNRKVYQRDFHAGVERCIAGVER
jgi:hypothetical protein